VNPNAFGFSDLLAGFKWAFLTDRDTVASLQFKTYIPTGDPTRGLGTNHVSLEPGLLLYQKLSERWTFEGEFRAWIPAGGTDFAGNIIRYGIGLSYGERSPDSIWLTPVVEFVGWTVLDGKETVVAGPVAYVQDAAGDTILNAKLGVRLGLGNRADLYGGYGRALTGPTWYRDTFRFELRLGF
jgi:hypothetical protein